MHLLAASSFIVSVVLAASGCKKPAPFDVGKLSDSQKVLGNRRYRVFLPKTYNSGDATPVILSYHGANRQLEDQVDLDGLTTPFFNKEYIVVYLQGNADNEERPDHTTWEGAPGNESDDFAFTTAVLDALDSSLCIDTKRIYATGKSQGGGFVGRLACHPTLSKRIAAFAPVSGAYYIKEIGIKSECEQPSKVAIPCEAGRGDIPIMAFHGGADQTIKYHGEFQNYCLPDIRHWAQEWVKRDGLKVGDENNKTIDGSDKGVVSSWGNGLVTLVYDGGNIKHDWPSMLRNDDNKGGPKAAFNATSWIVDFFGAHRLPADK
ncbi:uncharacterized protein JN550_010510 [Neoarthrinium moseri]|uniref:uncharacterized protein n=1 Tax=Neoarthrinium moseri TaxID=1658444 RepID=UPI001FDD9890|nr:uncharacterized protein JN550_010510 [Neoarthrinium moseri]KAI1862045.1 hypothetical protein JN550_010510 [Neoarthrinium moseri]